MNDYMKECINEQRHEKINKPTNKWTIEWIKWDEWINVWKLECMNERMNELKNDWMNRRIESQFISG